MASTDEAITISDNDDDTPVIIISSDDDDEPDHHHRRIRRNAVTKGKLHRAIAQDHDDIEDHVSNHFVRAQVRRRLATSLADMSHSDGDAEDDAEVMGSSSQDNRAHNDAGMWNASDYGHANEHEESGSASEDDNTDSNDEPERVDRFFVPQENIAPVLHGIQLPIDATTTSHLARRHTRLPFVVRSGSTYQLSDGHDFIHVEKLYRGLDGQFYLQGWYLRNSREERKYFSSKGELYLISHSPDWKSRADPPFEACQVTVKLTKQLRPVHCLFTNGSQSTATYSNGLPTFVCRRWLFHKLKPGSRIQHTCSQVLTKSQCELLGGTGVNELARFQEWRGKISRGSLWADKKMHGRQPSDMQYCFGDMFAGGGGSARGGEMAGCKIRYVVEKDADAAYTLRLNFPGAAIHSDPVDEWLILARQDKQRRVDILWISPPCPSFSRANRSKAVRSSLLRLGRHIKRILQHTRPRIVIMEQVDDIRTAFGGKYFYEYLQQFGELDYDWRAGRENLRDFGLSQKRIRLSVVGSCPGEPLPKLPPITHGPGLLPYVTMADDLNKLKAANLDLSEELNWHKRTESEPYDANKATPTITTQLVLDHPDGGRTCSIAEHLAFQGFLPGTGHVFLGEPRHIRKQGGNAVPPPYAALQTSNAILSLRKNDITLLRQANEEAAHRDVEDSPDEESDSDSDLLDFADGEEEYTPSDSGSDEEADEYDSDVPDSTSEVDTEDESVSDLMDLGW